MNKYYTNFIFLQCSKSEICTPHSEYKNVQYKSQYHSCVTIVTVFTQAIRT